MSKYLSVLSFLMLHLLSNEQKNHAERRKSTGHLNGFCGTKIVLLKFGLSFFMFALFAVLYYHRLQPGLGKNNFKPNPITQRNFCG